MKKVILLSATMLMLGTGAANAGGFHLNLFAPAPVYAEPVYVVQPRPVYVQRQPAYYASAYPAYNYQYNYWYYENGNRGHWNKKHNKHRGHDRHDRHDRGHNRH